MGIEVCIGWKVSPEGWIKINPYWAFKEAADVLVQRDPYDTLMGDGAEVLGKVRAGNAMTSELWGLSWSHTILGSQLQIDMAFSKTASYRKEKQKTDAKCNAPLMIRPARKGVLQDEGSHIVEHQERDLIIVGGGTG
ncbi:hypothetical protein Scep_026078 [Stephania cephalantha]|uniref:Uncharacterized protein n=1 Tax=Stephania cephalantha TaxID=152367 RepID=A0AAP0EJV8_9MAGN